MTKLLNTQEHLKHLMMYLKLCKVLYPFVRADISNELYERLERLIDFFNHTAGDME